LQRLHIAETPVTDLSPLKGMRLTRLVFTPANITAGIDVAKSLPLQEIGTRFRRPGQGFAAAEQFLAGLRRGGSGETQNEEIPRFILSVRSPVPATITSEFHERVCLHP
jgi:hypothetical protein